MKWILLGTVVVILLPFYVYILSKCATWGRLIAYNEAKKQLIHQLKGDYTNGEEKGK